MTSAAKEATGPQDRWARDADYDMCISCSAKFSMLTRRHHCRSCGELFCERCSAKSLRIPSHPNSTDEAKNAKKRVCKHCEHVVAAAVSASGGDYRTPYAYALYRIFLTTLLDGNVRRHRTATTCNNMFAFDIKDIQGRIAESLLSTSTTAFTEAAGKQLGSSPKGLQGVDAAADSLSALSLIFHRTSSKQHEQLQRLLDSTNEHALRLRVILSKKSLTAFYEVVHALLVHIFGLNLAAQPGSKAISPPPFTSISSSAANLDVTMPKVTKALFDSLPVLSSTGSPTASQQLPEHHAACLNIDSLISVLSEFACALTMRYEEQLACLKPASAAVVAETSVLRIVAHCQAIDRGTATHDSGSFHELFFSAVVHQRSQQQALPLSTLLPDVDQLWTDDGVLSCCGLRTADRRHYDPAYLDSGGSGAVASVAAASTERSSLLRKYYYRLGTDDEALALRMNPTGMLRHSKTPVWSIERQFEEQQLLSRRRELLLLSYASARLQPAGGCWSRVAEATPRSPSSARRGQDHTSAPNSIYSDVIRRCRDLSVNREIFHSMLTQRCTEAEKELDEIYQRLQELTVRFDDVATGSYCSASTRGYLASLQRLQSVAETREVTQKLAVFTKYRTLLRNQEKTVSGLYLQVRLRLLMAVLCSAQPSNEDSHVRLLGNSVPRSDAVRRALDALVAEANLNPVFRSWSRADIADRHLELVARTTAERYAYVVQRLDESSFVVFADCLVARLLRLLASPEEYGLRPAQLFDPVMVERIELVSLKDTVAAVDAVFLHSVDDGRPLKEHSIHVKAGLVAPDGRCFVGVRPKLPSAVSTGLTRGHHKPLKYGHLFMFPGEFSRKKLLQVSSTWGPPKSVKDNNGPASKSFPSGLADTGSSSNLLTTSAVTPLGPQFQFSVVSVCPRLVSPGDVIGLTLAVRGKDSVLPTELPEKDTVKFVALSDSTCAASMAAEQYSDDSFIETQVGEGGTVRGTTKCCTAGTFVVAALWRGILLTGNAVTVRPTSVDWAKHSTLDVTPSAAIFAGDIVMVRMMLRDSFGNLTGSSGPGDFNVLVENEGAVVPSPISEEADGSFFFTFVPTNHGPISVAVSVAGATLSYSQRQLTCLPGPVDFKNSLFSFDEVEVEAGQCVHGNLLLRDTYGNKVVEDEEHPVIEATNGVRETIALERLDAGEYSFVFRPTQTGIALVRATSRRSNSTLVARVVVRPPSIVCWQQCSIRCTSKRLFAGEEAVFHIALRDEYGNSVAVPRAVSERFSWSLRYTDGVACGQEVETKMDSAIASQEQCSSIVFTALVTTTGKITATVSYDGDSRDSEPVQVDSAALDWASSALVAQPSAPVGSSVTVRIQCRDRFGNPTAAHATDFIASVRSAIDGTLAKVQPLVLVSPSDVSFNFISIRAGPTTVAVTYAGHSRHELLLEMVPSNFYFANCIIELAPCNPPTTRAGEAVALCVRFKDIYNNDCAAVPGMLSVTLRNEDDAVPAEFVDGYGSEADPLAWCRSYAVATVRRAGRVAAVVSRNESPGDEKRSNALTVVPNVLDWSKTQLSTSPSDSARAGMPLTVTVSLFDSFGNPVVGTAPEAVAAVATNVCGDVSRQLEPTVLALVLKQSSVLHELTGQVVADYAGWLRLEASLCETEPSSASCLPGPTVTRDVAIVAASIDWLGKSSVDTELASVVAGSTLSVFVRFRDALGNPAALTDVSAADVVGTCSDGTPIGLESEWIATEGKSVVTLVATPTAAGDLEIAVRFKDVLHPTRLAVHVLPGPCSWASSTSLWSSPQLVAGVEAGLVIVPRDCYGNETSSELPDLGELDAAFLADSTIIPTVQLTGSRFLVTVTPTAVSSDAALRISHGGIVHVSTAQAVLPGPPHWPNCSLRSAGGTSATNSASSIIAGHPFKLELHLFDQFRNRAHADRSLLQVLPSHAERDEEELAGLLDVAISSDDNSTYAVTVVPRLAGKHSVALGLVGFADEGEYLCAPFAVEAGPVHWPQGCTIHIDNDVVNAGDDVFATVELRDEFGNATSAGWTVASIHGNVMLGSEVVARRVPAMALPHSRTEIGFSIEATRVGATTLAIELDGAPGVAADTQGFLVLPGEPSWEHCSLIPAAPVTAAGDPFFFGLLVRDRFSNICSSSSVPTANSQSADDDDALLGSAMAEFLDQTMNLISAVCTSSNKDNAVLTSRLPSAVRTEALPAVARIASGAQGGEPHGLSKALLEQSCSIIFTVKPVIAGTAALEVTHKDSQLVLTAATRVDPRPSAELVADATPRKELPDLALFASTFAAGSQQVLRFLLADPLGNVLTSPHTIASTLELDVLHEGKTKLSADEVAVEPAQVVDDLVVEIAFIVRRADTSPEQPATLLSLSTPLKAQPVVQTVALVASSAPSAQKSSFGPLSGPARAGEAFSAKLYLSDAFGNQIRRLGTDSGCVFHSSNGSVQPCVSTSVECGADGSFDLVATPTDALTLQFHFEDAQGQRRASATVPVLPGPLHWPSCTVKIIEDAVKAGTETNVIVQTKDAFGNAVVASSVDDFTMEIDNGTSAPIPSSGFVASGKSLTASFRPPERGTAFCKVTYSACPGDIKTSNVIRVT